MLAIQRPQNTSWLIDSTANIYVNNDQDLITKYYKQLTKIGKSITNKIFPRSWKVRLRLSFNNGCKGVIFNLNNVYFPPSSFSNLISFGFFNDYHIFHNNKNENLHNYNTKQILAHAKRWRNNFFLKSLNLSDAAVHLITIDKIFYYWPNISIHYTSFVTSKQNLST